MATNNNQSTNNDAFLQPMLDFWTDCIETSNEQVKVLLDSMTGTADIGTLRRRWLESMADSFDSYMRTPVFLEAMRRQFESITTFKSTAEDVVQELSRNSGIPRIQDISGLFERMKTTQEVILQRLATIEERLAALEKTRETR